MSVRVTSPTVRALRAALRAEGARPRAPYGWSTNSESRSRRVVLLIRVKWAGLADQPPPGPAISPMLRHVDVQESSGWPYSIRRIRVGIQVISWIGRGVGHINRAR